MLVASTKFNYLLHELNRCYGNQLIGLRYSAANSGNAVEQRKTCRVKSPLKLNEIWTIRIQMKNRVRELALFNFGIDSKLRGCDLVKLRVCDISNGGIVSKRASVTQRKTNQPVQFEITKQTQDALKNWMNRRKLQG